MKKRYILTIGCILAASGCKSAPRYPTDKEWGRTPIMKSDHRVIEVQGDFKNDISKFLIAAAKIQDGIKREEVKKIGFNPDLQSQPCETIDWLETSQIVLGNAVINVSSIERAIENRKQYTAIRCRAKDIKVRTDRALAYVNHKDSYGKGLDITLTIIFKDDKVAGVDLNKKPIKSHDRQSAFLKVLGEVIGTPKVDVKSPSIP
jgi:hypothetical protein